MSQTHLQCLSKVLNTKSISLLTNDGVDKSFFLGYENEYDFVMSHYNEYKNVPDIPTFLEHFPDFEVLDVTESDRYLVDKLWEEHTYNLTKPILEKSAELMGSDSKTAVDYLNSQLKTLPKHNTNHITSFVGDAESRYDQYLDRKNNQDSWYFTTGFPELDELTHGIQRGEELMVLFARVNQGKSWILSTICQHIWEIGFNVGYISPEMSANSVFMRMDTLHKHFSNKGLMWGKDNSINDDEYRDYIDDLRATHKNDIYTAIPKDFDNRITVTKLKNFILEYKLDCLAIDGIKYLSDERARRNDNTTTSLTNISEDLMALSLEMKVPIIVVVQANREAVKDGKPASLELETIRDSDGISHNASRVISVRQIKGEDTENVKLELGIKKQRFGPVGGKIYYSWNIDKGTFSWLPSDDDAVDDTKREETMQRNRKKFSQDATDVF